jgi:hypothetical protein
VAAPRTQKNSHRARCAKNSCKKQANGGARHAISGQSNKNEAMSWPNWQKKGEKNGTPKPLVFSHIQSQRKIIVE